MTKLKKNLLYVLYILIILICILLFIVCKFQFNIKLYFVAVTLLTIFTHFTIRISIANFICRVFIKSYNSNNSYFKIRKWEKLFYKLIFVKKWKSKLPTWNVESFDLKKVQLKTVLENMCRAEVYHQVCAILSFFPILYSIEFGKFYIFFWTSIGGAIFDELFVIIQRYNRPRVEKLIK